MCSAGNSWPAAAATAGRCQTTHRCSDRPLAAQCPAESRVGCPCVLLTHMGAGGCLVPKWSVSLAGHLTGAVVRPQKDPRFFLLASFPGRAVSRQAPEDSPGPGSPSGCGRAGGAQSCLRPSFADACTENQPCLLLPRKAGLPLSPPRAFPAPRESGPNVAGCDQNCLLLNQMGNLQFQVRYDRCPNLLHARTHP